MDRVPLFGYYLARQFHIVSSPVIASLKTAQAPLI